MRKVAEKVLSGDGSSSPVRVRYTCANTVPLLMMAYHARETHTHTQLYVSE